MIAAFIEGPLLWFSIIFCLAALLLRGVIFAIRISRRRRASTDNVKIPPVWTGLLPLHRALWSNFFYASTRLIFHAGLVILPIFLSGHIALWEWSRFGWSWYALPDELADGLTLLLLALCAYFFIRRLLRTKLRRVSRPSEWLVVWLAGLPLLTGYLLTHGGAWPGFIDDNLYHLHILTGEIMLISTGFLIVALRVAPDLCVGCAACGINCPSEALEVIELDGQRHFTHTARTCFVCGRCLAACPEKAVGYYHAFSLQALVGGYSKRHVRYVTLLQCAGCGADLVPAEQMALVSRLTGQNGSGLCPACQRREQMRTIYGMKAPGLWIVPEDAHEKKEPGHS